ncbi:MAG: hypothetical protein HYX86_02270 [Chloroflexi bacterium]|nr:hypothetical protein [Chloroflexota bacterium]
MKHPKQRLLPRRSGNWAVDYLIPGVLVLLAVSLLLLVFTVFLALSGQVIF